MVWVRARFEVDADDVQRLTEFWTGVVGGPLPPYLAIAEHEPRTGRRAPSAVRVVIEHDAPPPTAPPASFPGVRRTRVYQVCVDLPRGRFHAAAETWALKTGGRLDRLARRPEFTWVRIPGDPPPLALLLQRLDEEEGPGSAHVDVGTSDRVAEVRRHLVLGATLVAEEDFWTVLSDPSGLPYCVTDRDPATGELTR